MIVITRNGRTQVLTGWREWLFLAGLFIVSWLALALIALVFIGMALTVGILFLLVVPAVIIVAALSGLLRR
ncbi:MAG: hypothetical protein AB7O43_06305 [Hyphomicrobiaceae bacterium]